MRGKTHGPRAAPLMLRSCLRLVHAIILFKAWDPFQRPQGGRGVHPQGERRHLSNTTDQGFGASRFGVPNLAVHNFLVLVVEKRCFNLLGQWLNFSNFLGVHI